MQSQAQVNGQSEFSRAKKNAANDCTHIAVVPIFFHIIF